MKDMGDKMANISGASMLVKEFLGCTCDKHQVEGGCLVVCPECQKRPLCEECMDLYKVWQKYMEEAIGNTISFLGVCEEEIKRKGSFEELEKKYKEMFLPNEKKT